MTEIQQRLGAAFQTAFGGLSLPALIESKVKAGPLGLRIRLPSADLASAYLRAFPPEAPPQIDLDVLVLTAAELDLSDLIPTPTEQGRALIDETYFAVWHPDNFSVFYLLDRAARRGIIWLRGGAAPDWEYSRPACPLIHGMTVDTPWTTAHGAAIGQDGRFLLLAGKGGAGKTTAALACARIGWDYAGDDQIIIETSKGWIEPLYRSARLRIDMVDAFADVLPAASRAVSHDDGDIRHELDLSGLIGAGPVRGGNIAAILLPQRRGAAVTEFRRARPSDAFHALFTTTSLGVPWPLKQTAAKLSAVAGLAPVWFVDTGQDPAAIPAAFSDFLGRIAGS